MRQDQPQHRQALQHGIFKALRLDATRGHDPQCPQAKGAVQPLHRGKDIQPSGCPDETLPGVPSRRGAPRKAPAARRSLNVRSSPAAGCFFWWPHATERMMLHDVDCPRTDAWHWAARSRLLQAQRAENGWWVKGSCRVQF